GAWPGLGVDRQACSCGRRGSERLAPFIPGVRRKRRLGVARTLASLSIRIAVLASLTCALIGVLAGVAGGQTETSRPPRVRTLLNTAREMFKRGDYESAAV